MNWLIVVDSMAGSPAVDPDLIVAHRFPDVLPFLYNSAPLILNQFFHDFVIPKFLWRFCCSYFFCRLLTHTRRGTWNELNWSYGFMCVFWVYKCKSGSSCVLIWFFWWSTYFGFELWETDDCSFGWCVFCVFRDAVIYALGVGACGKDALDESELKYIYHPDGQQSVQVSA